MKKSKINEDLNKSDAYKNIPCTNCGRKFPETVLNIEEQIHHPKRNKGYRCLDTLSCNQARKKMKS